MDVLSVPWRNQRAINRVYRWLDLTPDWSGYLYRKGVKVGYKSSYGNTLNFHLTSDIPARYPVFTPGLRRCLDLIDSL